MAYKPSGLQVKDSGMSGNQVNEWIFDTEDSFGDVTGTPTAGGSNTDFIDDATERGMQVGDIVIVRQWTTFTDGYNRTGPLLSGGVSFVGAIVDGTGNNAGKTYANLTAGQAIAVT